jgi:hypothetical protein
MGEITKQKTEVYPPEAGRKDRGQKQIKSQKSKCKITVQKSKIPRLAVALAAMVRSTSVENVLQIGLFFAKQSQFM